jgi:lysophospholipase L1-like esterase
MNEKTKKLIFWVITLVFPFLILLLFEAGLRIGGYNDEAQELFVETPNSSAYLLSNTKFIERYFPNFVPQIAPNTFRKEKRSNTFRIFVFGGSSTQGFPYNFYYSFADQLEQRLLLNTQGVNVEVINLGMTAVNSYVIRDLSERVMDYDPDAIIIYAGHNEYYGSFGAASTQFGFVNNVGVKRLILWLKNWRLYQFMESLVASDAGETGEQRTMMAKVISNSDIVKDGDIYHHGIDQFESNIESVLSRYSKAGIPVFIGTVASNLKDQDPLTDDDPVLSVYVEAERLFGEGNIEGALEKYLESKELDGVRFRAPQKINDTIREVASNTSATVVEIEDLLRAQSESGIEDESLFIDHLHPNHIGHQLMAEAFLDEILQLPRLSSRVITNEFETPSAISRFENAHANTAISRLLVGYPFEKGFTVEEELDAFQDIYEQYLSTSYIDSVAAVTSREGLFVPPVLTEVVNHSRSNLDTVTAMAHYYELMKWQLNSIDLIERGIEFAVDNRASDEYLANMLLQILNDGNYDPRYIDVLASLYLLRENTYNAEYWLRESERLEPNSPRLLYNYTRFYLLKGDTLQGQQYFQRFLESQRGN